jgi:hypothetical protein
VENASSAPTAEEGGLKSEEVVKAQERQKLMEETEERIVSTENKRNEIEQFMYHMRDKADDKSLASCFKDNEKQRLVRPCVRIPRLWRVAPNFSPRSCRCFAAVSNMPAAGPFHQHAQLGGRQQLRGDQRQPGPV